MKYYIQTFGCQMNVYDTDSLSGLLDEAGHESTESLEDAELILLNTCAIREGAEDRVRGRSGQLKALKDRGSLKYLGICGCMAQKEGQRLLDAMPYLDLVMGPGAIGSIPRLVDQLKQGDRPILNLTGLEDDYDEVYPAPVGEVQYPRFVSVMKGCDYKCTFCVVPNTRGPERSRAPHIILQEVENLVNAGHREITLIGQTINAYQWQDIDFSALLQMVHDVEGLERIRFTTSHPRNATPRMLETMVSLPKICEQLHLPVQSGSNRVLRRMKRLYTREAYLETIALFKNLYRERGIEPAITTDMIVGFPGETEEDFEQTLTLVQEVEYDQMFMFKYSPRRGTAAVKLDGMIDNFTQSRRLDRLIKLNQEIARTRSEALVDTVQPVLIERSQRDDDGRLSYEARLRGGRIVKLYEEQGPFAIGDMVDVRITRCQTFTLYAEPVLESVAGCGV